MMNGENIQLNTLVEKSVGEQLKKEMEISLREIYRICKIYSGVLHDGNILKTQKMIKDAFFPTDKPIISKDDEIQVDMKVIIEGVPDEKKRKIYQLIQEKIATQIDVSELAEKD